MQAHKTRNATQAINYTQSLAAVQTLLRAGLGAITYLRNLLPEDNFVPSHFTSANNEVSDSLELESSQENAYNRQNGNGFSIMTLTRGYTDEADRLLNYLEYGIFDALEKRYLRSFIFAIYLDNKDPNNIVEAYTFNFKYHTLPGSNTAIPVMSLGESLQKMSLNRKHKEREDPVTRAIKSGKTPTLKEVKMSVKTLLKTLITAMNNMEFLPRRRFATFKVFYTEETPIDYEPPHFEAADTDKDKWYFMTHAFDEVPDKYSIGKLDTGHHAVNLTVTSITSFLPSSTEHDNDAFGGTVAHAGRMTLTPLQEANLSKEQAEKQLVDAGTRNVVWSADRDVDIDDLDAEGEDDPDYVLQADGTYVEVDPTPAPIGIRGKEGIINPISDKNDMEEAQYGGVSEHVPTKLQEVAAKRVPAASIEETQLMFLTPKNKYRGLPSQNDLTMSSPDSISTVLNTASGFGPSVSIGPSESHDIGMLDLETQPLVEGGKIESIESFMTPPPRESIQTKSPTVIYVTEDDDNGLDCDCEIDIEDEMFFCEGGCKKWFHAWCMGYHSVKDPRTPMKFICFDCQARSGASWDLIKLNIYQEMFSNFKELTLFRRAIKVAEQMKAFAPSEFHRTFGSNAIGAQMVKRLEAEEFILRETTTVDDAGMTSAYRSKPTKGKGKGNQATAAISNRPRRNLQKSRFVFNFSMQTTERYREYFEPNDGDVQDRLLGISMLKAKYNVQHNTSTETQTQDETQLTNGDGNHKRPGLKAVDRPSKKMKVSVAVGVDLAE